MLKNMPVDIYRTIDANINRISEGLRVLEDVARFMVNDAKIGIQLKTIRHDLLKSVRTLNISMLSHRDVSNDYGAVVKESALRKDISSVVSANSRRVQEGLRVLEELSKLDQLKNIINPGIYKKARFSIYNIERSLISITTRKELSSKISGLYFIPDTDLLNGRDIIEVTSKAIDGGAGIIQLRDKRSDKNSVLETAYNLKALCARKGALFIINDYPDIALASDADGIHIGQSDLPVKVVRDLLPINKIIGCSADTVPCARKAQKDGADYIAVGAIFPTSTKYDIDVVGLKKLAQIKKSVEIPVVAIGGINRSNITETVKSGADSVAVISAILSEPNTEKAAFELTKLINKARKSTR